jgi:hypothetical protein
MTMTDFARAFRFRSSVTRPLAPPTDQDGLETVSRPASGIDAPAEAKRILRAAQRARSGDKYGEYLPGTSAEARAILDAGRRRRGEIR